MPMSKHSHAIRLLVVDDEPACVDELCEFLGEHGYHAYACYNASQACEQFRRDPQIGIALCDLNMPDLNGIELIQALEAIAAYDRPFQAVIFTGQGDAQHVIEAMRAGVADFFEKPVDTQGLLKTLARLEEQLNSRQLEYQRLADLNQNLQHIVHSLEDLHRTINSRRHIFGRPTHPHPNLAPAQALLGNPATPPLLRHLSPRQQAVAQLIARGMTNYQIACELGITENTVKLYVSQILRLTQMHNRTQLALALTPAPAPTPTPLNEALH